MQRIPAIVLTLSLCLAAQSAEAAGRGKACRAPGGAVFCDSERSYFPSTTPRRRGGEDQDRARDASRAGEVMPLENILRGVRQRYRGRLLDANLMRAGTGYVYLIKIIDDSNRVRILQVDARTGRVMGAR